LHDPSPLAGWEDRPFEINGRTFPLMLGNTWSHFATVTGLPATVAPNGKSGAGLPIGVEIIGPYLEDRTPIAFAGLIEREFGGFVPPPDLG
jgi:amidase